MEVIPWRFKSSSPQTRKVSFMLTFFVLWQPRKGLETRSAPSRCVGMSAEGAGRKAKSFSPQNEEPSHVLGFFVPVRAEGQVLFAAKIFQTFFPKVKSKIKFSEYIQIKHSGGIYAVYLKRSYHCKIHR